MRNMTVLRIIQSSWSLSAIIWSRFGSVASFVNQTALHKEVTLAKLDSLSTKLKLKTQLANSHEDLEKKLLKFRSGFNNSQPLFSTADTFQHWKTLIPQKSTQREQPGGRLQSGYRQFEVGVFSEKKNSANGRPIEYTTPGDKKCQNSSTMHVFDGIYVMNFYFKILVFPNCQRCSDPGLDCSGVSQSQTGFSLTPDGLSNPAIKVLQRIPCKNVKRLFILIV